MNIYYLGSMLNTASLYMAAGLGATISMKAGEFNLGGEGQIYAGGFICAITTNFLAKTANFPGIIAIFFGLSAAFCCSALLTLISGLLKRYRNASYLLTTFILSAAIIPIIDGLIAGKFRGQTGNLLATSFLPVNCRFKSILPPSPLNGFMIAAIILCVLTGLFLYKNPFGKQICIYGKASEFALYSGFSENKIVLISSALSGGLHGLTGAVTVLGTYYTCHSGFYAGIGWNALAAAMIAATNPYLLIPSSIVMSALITYSTKFALFNNFDFDIGGLIQGVIIFLIAIPVYRRKK